jgi:hypothetical protein
MQRAEERLLQKQKQGDTAGGGKKGQTEEDSVAKKDGDEAEEVDILDP